MDILYFLTTWVESFVLKYYKLIIAISTSLINLNKLVVANEG